jgi:hypothetical protein
MKISNVQIPLDYKSPFWKDNFNFIKEYLMTQLGYPLIRVELTENHLITATHDAISQYLKYDGNNSIYMEKFTPDSNNFIQLPDHINTGLVRDVFFETNDNIFSTSLPTDGGVTVGLPLNNIFDVSMGFLDLTKYYMARMSLSNADNILGVDRNWEILNGGIKIYQTKNKLYNNVGVLFAKFLLPIEFEGDDWIRRFALARCKIMLGTIRRKFSGFAAAGGSASVDGDALISEGKTEETDLITEIKESRPGLPMMQF